ncbi:MAG: PAS domain S-box protein [Ignavibacteriales bacterium]|jgi:PAS domain S-box-containing protein|nr:PAS domain S-box protein [Ignavibacteriales bacterium]
MTIDVPTLYIVLVLLNFLQMIALYAQFKINKTYDGVGWWLLWSVFSLFGFGFTLLRDIPGIFAAVAILQNSAIVFGSIFVYIGMARFLNTKESPTAITTILLLFFSGFLYFLFVEDSSDRRGIMVNIALTTFAVITAVTMLTNRISSINNMMRFIAASLIVHGCLLLYRSYLMLWLPSSVDMFEPVFYNILPVIDAIIITLILTFGLIMLINQRLQSDITVTKNHFQSIFNLAPGAVLISTAEDGKIVEVNETFSLITGYGREEAIGKTTQELGLWQHNTDREWVVNDIKIYGQFLNREVKLNRKSGEEFIGLISGSVISLNDKPHIISNTQDVTEKYLAEEKVKASEEKYRTLTETTPNIILMHDFNGIITYINRAGLKLIQLPEKEIIGKSIKQFVPDALFEEVKERQKLRLQGFTDTLEYKTAFTTTDGRLLKIKVVSAPIIKNGKMESFLLVAHDITELENNLIELTKAKETAEEMNKIKSYFFANMSHELRTPFVGILGYTQIIGDKLANPDENGTLDNAELATMINRIMFSSERLMHTLNEILDFSKLEFQQVKVNISEFELNFILDDVCKTFNKTAWNKNLEIFCKGLPDNPQILSDEKMLRSILVNLVSNAVKYTPEGKIIISTDIIVMEKKTHLKLSVSDTGIGIPLNKRQAVWEAFRQVSEGHGRSFEGTGLGLTITKEYVTMLNGEISLESEEGEGSVFTVILPVTVL